MTVSVNGAFNTVIQVQNLAKSYGGITAVSIRKFRWTV